MSRQGFGSLAVVLLWLCLTDAANGIPLNLTEDVHNLRECPTPEQNAPIPLCNLNYQASGLFQTITKTITCPDSGVSSLRINCIIVTNLDTNDNGGYVSITAGGLNDFFVDIYLKSQWSKGLNFHIEVYTVKQ